MINKFKRILVDAYFDNNFGDDLFFELLGKQYPDAMFYIFLDKNNPAVYERLKEKKNTVILPGNCMLQEGDLFDGYIMIGGDVLPEGMNFKRRIDQMTAVKNNGGFVAMLGFNLYEEYSEKTIADLSKMADLADVIVVRDDISAKKYKSMVPKVQVISSTDMAFTADYYKKAEQNKEILGMSVRRKLYSTEEEFQQYCVAMAKLASAYLLKHPKGTVRMLALSVGEYDDRKIAENIIEHLADEEKNKTEITAYDGDVNAFIEAFGECEAVVATRFHALVLALMMRIPFVPVPYEVKLTQLLKQLDYKGSMIPYGKAVSEENLEEALKGLEKFNVATEALTEYENKATLFFEKADQVFAETTKVTGGNVWSCVVREEKDNLVLEKEQLERDFAFLKKENEDLKAWVNALQQEKEAFQKQNEELSALVEKERNRMAEQLAQSEEEREKNLQRLNQTVEDYTRLEATKNSLIEQLAQSEELRNSNWKQLVETTENYARLDKEYKALQEEMKKPWLLRKKQ